MGSDSYEPSLVDSTTGRVKKPEGPPRLLATASSTTAPTTNRLGFPTVTSKSGKRQVWQEQEDQIVADRRFAAGLRFLEGRYLRSHPDFHAAFSTLVS